MTAKPSAIPPEDKSNIVKIQKLFKGRNYSIYLNFECSQPNHSWTKEKPSLSWTVHVFPSKHAHACNVVCNMYNIHSESKINNDKHGT